MTPDSNKMISHFAGKPETQRFFDAIAAYTTALGPVSFETRAQASFAVKRKFLWLWAYEKTADGVLYVNLRLDRHLEDSRFHNVTQVSANRWNYHVVVRSEATATGDWLRGTIRQAYEFARS
ncbi:MAG: DUF5655 domain-containing protein [Bifidobacteriaceae bacterium]|jgi:hypothetical protein|nr:DUF5655 domain-containing protein [Bifidobacteriaceae bacterium]